MCKKLADQPRRMREQILKRIERRQVEGNPSPEKPNLVVFASPVCFGSPLISVAAIDRFMFESRVIPCGTRQPVGEVGFTSQQVEGGVWCIREDNHNFFWELNEYGVIYNHEWVTPEPLTENEVNSTELYLPSHDILTQLFNFIRAARSFYQRCSNADNIKIEAQLRQVNGRKLKFKDYDWDRADSEIRVSHKSKISAATQCLPQDLQKADAFAEVLFGLSGQLVKGFNQKSSQHLWSELKEDWRHGIANLCRE